MTRLFLSALTALVIALPAHAGALQNAVLAHAEAQPEDGLAFTRTTRFEGTEKSGETTTKIFVERYDPSKPMSNRWQLVSIDGNAPTKKELKSAAKRYKKEDIPSYHRVSRWIGQSASESGNELRFSSFSDDTFEGGPADLSDKLSGVATISDEGGTPWVKESRFRLIKPTRIMLVAKLNDMQTHTRFRRLPSGMPVIDQQSMTMTGSMMGKSGTQKTVTRYSDYRIVP